MSDVLETGHTPYLPIEITDTIIDLLQTDSKAILSSCTLVSRSWLPRSRLHLFTRVQVLELKTRFEPFIELLTQAGGPRLDPPISTTIKRLRLDASGRAGEEDIVLNTPAPLTMVMLKMLLSNLPNLLDLDIHGVKLTWLEPGPPDTGDVIAIPDLIHLNSLTLDSFTTSSKDPSDFISSLSLFSSIDVLRISDVFHIDIPEDPAAIAAHPTLVMTNPYFPSHLEISSIEVRDDDCTPFLLALLQKTASVETINKLGVVCRTRVHADALGSFLDNVGAKIRKLSVDIVMLFQEPLSPTVVDALHIPACTALTHLNLRISLILDLRNRLNTRMFIAASRLIACASRTVQTVVLNILLGGSYVGVNKFKSLIQTMTTEFKWLQSVIKQKGSRLCIRWNGLERMVKRVEKRERVEDQLCGLVRSHLLELDADGMLTFGGDVEDLYCHAHVLSKSERARQFDFMAMIQRIVSDDFLIGSGVRTNRRRRRFL